MEREEEEKDEGEAHDDYLETRLARYDKWVKEGKIPYSSKVVPVQKSIEVVQWILPKEQVTEILRQARSVAVTDCICRAHYKRCDNPIEVCLRLNQAADSCVAHGKGRYVTLEEACEILQKADERGLVHMTVYTPEQQIYAVCSCCSCCCHEFQYIQKYGRRDLVARSEYIVYTDPDACTGCKTCLDRCPFRARIEEKNIVKDDPESCYGCGLCITTCPEGAITLEPREPLSSTRNIHE